MLAINILMSALLMAAPSGIDSWPDRQSKTLRADSAAAQDDQDTEEQDEAPPEEAQEEPQADEPEAPPEEPQQDAQTEEEAPPADTTDQDQTTGDGGSDDAAPTETGGDEDGGELTAAVDHLPIVSEIPSGLLGRWCAGSMLWVTIEPDFRWLQGGTEPFDLVIRQVSGRFLLFAGGVGMGTYLPEYNMIISRQTQLRRC